MPSKKNYAVLWSYGNYVVSKVAVLEAVGSRVRIDNPGRQVIDADMVFSNRIDALKKCLEMHDKQSSDRRKQLLASIKRELKKSTQGDSTNG